MPPDSVVADTRAVEGMPIRLVVAIAVGAAALGVLLPMLDSFENTEEPVIRAVPDSQQVMLTASSPQQEQTIAVRTADGEPVSDARILLSGHSLPVSDGPHVFETGPDSNQVSITIGTGPESDLPVEFRPDQTRGTVHIAVRPPPGTAYRQGESPKLTVRTPLNRN